MTKKQTDPCPNCGAPIEDGKAFCSVCGQKILKKAVKKKSGFGVVGICLLVVVLAVGIIKHRKVTVNPDKYISISFSGRDGSGKAEYTFDRERFLEDYSKKIRYNTKKKGRGIKVAAHLFDGSAPEVFMYTCLDGHLDKKTGLSNGDKVKFVWDCKDEAAKKGFNCRIKCKDVKKKVKGLREVTNLDPFKNIKIHFTGKSPHGEVQIDTSDNKDLPIRYVVENNGELRNGDKAKITIDEYAKEELLSQYDLRISPEERIVPVVGLPEKITSLKDIPEKVLETLKKEADERLTAKSVQIKERDAVMSNPEYLGCLFRSSKEGIFLCYETSLFLVYRYNLSFKETGETVPVYTYLRYRDLELDETGKLSTPPGDGRTPLFRHKISLENGEEFTVTDGYPSYDALYEDAIISHLDDCTHEDQIEKSGES